MPLRCLIIDDNPGFLAAARHLLEGEDLTVAGVASSAADGLRKASELRPDVALVDIELGGESGFQVAEQLAATGNGHRHIILISTYSESDFAELIAESPAVGFVSKSDLSRQAIRALIS